MSDDILQGVAARSPPRDRDVLWRMKPHFLAFRLRLTFRRIAVVAGLSAGRKRARGVGRCASWPTRRRCRTMSWTAVSGCRRFLAALEELPGKEREVFRASSDGRTDALAAQVEGDTQTGLTLRPGPQAGGTGDGASSAQGLEGLMLDGRERVSSRRGRRRLRRRARWVLAIDAGLEPGDVEAFHAWLAERPERADLIARQAALQALARERALAATARRRRDGVC